MEPFRTVSPPLLTIGLLLFSLLIGPGWMVFWATIYSCMATAILLNPRIYQFFINGFTSPEMSSHKFRVLEFISTAIFACIFSWILNRLRRKQEMMDHLLLEMPLPVVVSDIEGVIVLANQKACDLLGLSGTEREKGLFFDLLAPKLHQGSCIAAYLNIFKKGCSDGETLNLEIAGKPLQTHLEVLNSSPRKLVTMIQPEA
jgi:PAS domain-containing protein